MLSEAFPRPDGSSQLSLQKLVAIAIGSAVLSALFGLSNLSPGFGAAVSVAWLVLLSIVLVPEKYVIYPILIITINMLDHTSTAEVTFYTGEVIRASLWQLTAFDIPPAIFVFSVLVARALMFGSWRSAKQIKWLIVYFVAIMPVVSLAYVFFVDAASSRIIGDVKVPLFFAVGFILFDKYYRQHPKHIWPSCQIIYAMFLGHFCLDYAYLLTQRYVDDTAGFGNVSLDSGKGLVCVLMFGALAQIIAKRGILLNLLILVLSLHLLVSYQTRWLLVVLAAGVLLSILFSGYRGVVGGLVAMIFLTLVVPVVIELSPVAWEVMQLRFRVGEGTVNLSVAGAEAIDVTRVASIFNALGTLRANYAFLTGMGYGSWYDDKYYAFPPLTLHAFDNESLSTGRFYRVHDFAFHFLFKFGIIGLVLYVGMFAAPLLCLWRNRSALLSRGEFATMGIVLFGVSPLVISAMYWSGKGLLFSGMVVALAENLAGKVNRSSRPVSYALTRSAAHRLPR